MIDLYTSELYAKKIESIFVGPKARRAYTRKFSDMSVEVYPGINSGDAVFQSFLINLYRELSEQFPKSEIKDGLFIGAPINSDFSELLTKAGSVRRLPYNHHKDIERADDMSVVIGPQILEEVMALRYSSENWVDKSGSVTNNSSSGAPFFESSAEYKIKHLSNIAYNIRAIEECIMADRLQQLYDSFGILFFSNAQIRRQNDKWLNGMPKKRKVHSFIEAFNDVDSNTYYDDSELMYNQAGVRTGLATCRTRVVKAFSSIINYVMTSVVVPFRDGADKAYDFTYKHRTQADIVDKIKKFGYYKGIDIASFDSTVGYSLASLWLDNLPLSDAGKKIVKLLFTAPFFTSQEMLCSGNPFDISTFKYWGGIPSGIFCTSMMGKDIVSWAILTAYFSVLDRDPVGGEIDNILRGKDDNFGFLNQGDDSVLMSNKRGLLEEVIKKMNEQYFSVEEEEGVAFLGNMVYSEDGEVKCTNNLKSYFEGAYIPERSINSALRPYPILGFKLRREIYQTHPFFERAREIEKRLFREYFKVSQDYLENKYFSKPNIIEAALSSADIDVLTNYNRLYYKYSTDDIDPEIVKLYSSDIPKSISSVFQKTFLKE